MCLCVCVCTCVVNAIEIKATGETTDYKTYGIV